jgi:Asp-tRNA(Asn)/Glu-tRNA(Gln) amidotransferase A subunit family amidase
MHHPQRAYPAPLSALAIARAIANNRTSAVAAIDEALERIAAHDAELAAFVVTNAVDARAHAVEATGPLAGLALGVKDVFDTFDMPTQMGSAIYANYQTPGDAALVAQMRRLGASVVGKTTTTELQNRTVVAPTRNPWNPAHTPGGSSAGSAAAVGAGLIPVALGAQTAGSIIRPASYCGIAGFKPSYRLLSSVGMKAYAPSLDTPGFFAAGIEDVAYVAEQVTGRPMRVDTSEYGVPHIGLMRTHLWHEASGDMRDAVEHAAARARAKGAKVTEIEMPSALVDAFAAHGIIQNYQAAQSLTWEVDAHRPRLSPELLEGLDEGLATPPAVYDAARGSAKRGRMALKALFAETGIDVILTPSATGVAPEGLGATGNHMFNRLWTLMGTPAVNVPGLFSSSGLPLGVQIVGPFGRDHDCLKAAAFLSHAIV